MQMTSSQAATAAPVHILMEQSSLTARGSDPTCNIHIEISTSGITTVRGGAGLGGVGGERGAGDGWAVTGCSDITDTGDGCDTACATDRVTGWACAGAIALEPSLPVPHVPASSLRSPQHWTGKAQTPATKSPQVPQKRVPQQPAVFPSHARSWFEPAHHSLGNACACC